MSEKKVRGKGTRSFLALHKLEVMNLCPIEEALKDAAHLEALYEKNIDAFNSFRGWSEKGDTGAAYLSNAIKAKSEKMALWLKLSSYIYPTLAAIGVDDIRKEENKVTDRIVSAIEVRQAILSDPFAMQVPENAPILAGGIKTEDKENEEN